MVLVTGVDVEEMCGVQQLCSGLKADIEEAIHGMHELFELNSSEGVRMLLVDTKNAFNSVGREVALWNALWPHCSCFLFNTYQGYSSLWIDRCSNSVISKEGVTKGDPSQCCSMP